MANAVKIDCQPRAVKTKGFLNQLKGQAMVPGVVYGNGMNPVNIMTEGKQLDKVFRAHGTRGLFSLNVEGGGSPLMVVVREIQKHPVSGQFMHIDFLQVDMKDKITRPVVIHITGEEELAGRDARLQTNLQEIEISCLPANLPEAIVLNVANLEPGDRITVGDLSLPPGVEAVTDRETLVTSAVKITEAVEG